MPAEAMSTPATTLEQSFAAICETHGLTCLGLNYHPTHNLTGPFAAYAHDGDLTAHASADSIGQAISLAVADLAVKRFDRSAPLELAA